MAFVNRDLQSPGKPLVSLLSGHYLTSPKLVEFFMCCRPKLSNSSVGHSAKWNVGAVVTTDSGFAVFAKPDFRPIAISSPVYAVVGC